MVQLRESGVLPHDRALRQIFVSGVQDAAETMRPVEALLGDTPAHLGVQLRDGDAVWLDALFVAPRTHLASPIAERLGCAMEEGPQGPIVRTDAQKETSVKGVFCAGDAARAPHNIAFAVADGAMAGIAAHRSLVMG